MSIPDGKQCIRRTPAPCFFCRRSLPVGSTIFWVPVVKNPALKCGWHHRYVCETCFKVGHPPMSPESQEDMLKRSRKSRRLASSLNT